MKKMILFAAAIMMAFGASAQMSLVKDLAKKATSANPMDLITVLQQIEPAFTNPESANDVMTWYTAGKAAFGLYDKMYEAKLLQQPVEDSDMAQALIAAYDYYQKALPLDSIVEVDKNGTPKLNKDGSKQVKTKYSKEMTSSARFASIRVIPNIRFRTTRMLTTALIRPANWVTWTTTSLTSRPLHWPT